MLIKPKFCGQLLNQENVCVSLGAFSRVEGVELHFEYLLLEFWREEAVHLIGELGAVINI